MIVDLVVEILAVLCRFRLYTELWNSSCSNAKSYHWESEVFAVWYAKNSFPTASAGCGTLDDRALVFSVPSLGRSKCGAQTEVSLVASFAIVVYVGRSWCVANDSLIRLWTTCAVWPASASDSLVLSAFAMSYHERLEISEPFEYRDVISQYAIYLFQLEHPFPRTVCDLGGGIGCF